jgi:cyclophilin family peptidyl-prolyl cis-trans isomerase
MSFLRRSALVVVTSLFALVPARALRAQSTTPVVSQPLPAQTIAAGAGVSTIDLRNYFALPNVPGQIAQIDTVRGKFNVELLAADAPKTVANFLNYVNKGAYTRTFFHRSAKLGDGTPFVIQAGGFALPEGSSSIGPIAADAPVVNEFKVSNSRGTLAMAKTAAGPNTATNQWFVNLADNRANLDNQNGGFTVFARVIGTGMTVSDNIAALPVFNATDPQLPGSHPAFDQLPLTTNALNADTLVLVRSIKVIPVYPAAPGDTAVLAFSVASSEPAIVGATISGSFLVLNPGSGGRATLTVRATDVNGNAAESVFVVTNGAAPPKPTFITQPVAQTVAVGSTVVFNSVALGAPTFEWRRNGAIVAGASSATLVISGASAAQEGTYTVTATNASGAAISDSVTLKTNTATATQVGRLVNLSILTTAGTGSKILTVGASVGPLSSTEALPLVMRGVGPALKEFFGISGALDDPTMTIFPAGSSSALAANDNWGSGQATNSLFKSLGAFELSPGSLDSAFASLAPGLRVGGYTVQVAGKGSSSGTVIAEIYDAAGSARTATTPRLVNLSTRAQLDTAGELVVGFVLRGLSARTVLVRAVGPSLGALGVEGVMPDPKLELFDNDNGGKKIGENDNWGGDEQIVNVARSVGAFALAGNDTKDAVLLMTLPAGAYSARLSGVGGAGGTAIVEVYEVP